jgi:CubicO group peptidase (beta-lactamase class C family)
MKELAMRRLKTLVSLLFVLVAVAPLASAQDAYFPPRGEWETREPEEVGMNAERLQEAVEFCLTQENPAPRQLDRFIAATLANEPHGQIIGPTRERGGLCGLVIRNGYLVSEWGPTQRVDMTFSVTKTYLSTTVGLAYDDGLIPDLETPVVELVPTEHFQSERNSTITWDHLLRQSSDWRGILWGKPAWADRPPRGATLEEMQNVPLSEPGTRYEYNDVRVNLLALAALEVWRRPLPEVLRERVMDPIGASCSWRWHGYKNSWVVIDGLRMQSVSGGGHWGGGMFINAFDQARFAYLFLRNGEWDGRRIISEQWIEMARTPGPANQTYGFMNWFLNTPVPAHDGSGTHKPVPSAPDTAVAFFGAGSNVVYIDWENDLVVVIRWIGHGLDEFLGKVLASIES